MQQIKSIDMFIGLHNHDGAINVNEQFEQG